MQKKAVVIRHLYNEDGANIPEDTVTDVNEAFDVCDIKSAEITIPELHEKARFTLVSNISIREGSAHDVVMKEIE